MMPAITSPITAGLLQVAEDSTERARRDDDHDHREQHVQEHVGMAIGSPVPEAGSWARVCCRQALPALRMH